MELRPAFGRLDRLLAVAHRIVCVCVSVALNNKLPTTTGPYEKAPGKGNILCNRWAYVCLRFLSVSLGEAVAGAWRGSFRSHFFSYPPRGWSTIRSAGCFGTQAIIPLFGFRFERFSCRKRQMILTKMSSFATPNGQQYGDSSTWNHFITREGKMHGISFECSVRGIKAPIRMGVPRAKDLQIPFLSSVFARPPCGRGVAIGTISLQTLFANLGNTICFSS